MIGPRTMYSYLSKAMRKFVSDRRGTAAVEFAMNVPVLAAIIIPLIDVSSLAVGVSEMQTAARSTIQYAMNGGTDMSLAQNHGMAVWANRPANGTFSAVMACLCSGSANACDTPCPDGTPPQSYVTVSASATFTGNVFSSHRDVTAKVRVR